MRFRVDALDQHYGSAQVLRGVSFEIAPGETLGLVGESGCGKSTLARLIMRMIPPSAGAVLVDGQVVATLLPGEVLAYRRKVQMIFQDPYSSLNPRKTVGQIVGAPYAIHKTAGDTKARVRELLEMEFPVEELILSRYQSAAFK